MANLQRHKTVHKRTWKLYPAFIESQRHCHFRGGNDIHGCCKLVEDWEHVGQKTMLPKHSTWSPVRLEFLTKSEICFQRKIGCQRKPVPVTNLLAFMEFMDKHGWRSTETRTALDHLSTVGGVCRIQIRKAYFGILNMKLGAVCLEKISCVHVSFSVLLYGNWFEEYIGFQ